MKSTLGTRQRGISLIEAVVAMAIMAIGMLGMLGIQATLRGNSDIAKQRSEAVRIAQATMETRRSFSVLDSASGFRAYADIQDVASAPAAQADANASFTLEEIVDEFPSAAMTEAMKKYVAPHKWLQVNVSWVDRSGSPQNVRLGSIIGANAPAIAAALAAPATGSAVQGSMGRHRAIPPAAVAQSGADAGTSRLTLPGGSGVSWVFSNATGYITQTCVLLVCTDVNARLLSGYVRFATTATPPTTADAAVPPDPTAVPGVGVIVTLTDATVVDCLEDTSNASLIAYYCAVPLAGGIDNWNGRSSLTGLSPLATSASDATPTRYRVCRYTSSRWNTATPAVANEDHPLDYTTVKTALTNQNFLVIRAGGAGGVLYSCPDDTALLGRTFDHQPPS